MDNGDPRHGHRQRMRDVFLKDERSSALPDYQILEMLLFYVLPRRDTRVLAHRMIERFGSFSAVFDAPVSELVKVDGITENGAALLKLTLAAARVYRLDRAKVSGFESIGDIGAFLIDQYGGFTVEVLSMISLTAAGKFLGFDIINTGDPGSVTVSARKVVERVIQNGAHSVILAHNHPSGIAIPSSGDAETTKTIKQLLEQVGVHLLDHIVLDRDDFVSMAQSAEYSDIF